MSRRRHVDPGFGRPLYRAAAVIRNRRVDRMAGTGRREGVELADTGLGTAGTTRGSAYELMRCLGRRSWRHGSRATPMEGVAIGSGMAPHLTIRPRPVEMAPPVFHSHPHKCSDVHTAQAWLRDLPVSSAPSG